jgi:hypothetical protein
VSEREETHIEDKMNIDRPLVWDILIQFILYLNTIIDIASYAYFYHSLFQTSIICNYSLF